MADILIIRFSAIGDVATTVPAVDSLARQHPGNCYTVVSRDFLQPLFARCPENVRFVGVDLRNDYRGAAGMYRLYRKLSKQKFDAVADLHDVLRTKLLRIFFRCSGIKTACIDKGRAEKRQLTRKKNKAFKPLKRSTERYADVFRALGLPVTLDFHSIFDNAAGNSRIVEALAGKKSGRWIGIAPFAGHRGKIFPPERTEQIVAHFARQDRAKIFLFGGGAAEKATLDGWCARYPGTVSVAGNLAMSEELVLMSRLDVMLSMDSANMHLASLTATPVVSVWGATHPHAGFYGYNQLPENAVQTDLPCRPCSVYGNRPCYRGNTECMTGITPQMVIDRIEKAVSLSVSETNEGKR